MDLNKYLNNAAPSEPQYSKEDYAAMKKTEREAVWAQVDARMGEVLADAPALQEFLNFMSQCRNSLPNQLLLSGQNADITDARTFQQWKDAGTTLCAIVRECAQADFHKDYTYNRQAYAAPSYCAAYMVAHRYGLDTAAFNFDRVVALYGNLGKEQQRGFLSDVNIVGGGLLRSLSRTLAVQTREPPTAEYAVAVPSAKKQSRQRERG